MTFPSETSTPADIYRDAGKSPLLSAARPGASSAIGGAIQEVSIPSNSTGDSPQEDSSALLRLTPGEIALLDVQLGELPSEEILRWAWQRFGGKAAIGTSYQGAGLVMLHLAKTAGLNFPVFTLDTGLLFPETLALKAQLEDFFQIQIEALKPDLTVEQQAEVQGPELWKRDPDLCCTIRKVLPLRDKLKELNCWVTGLRRQQSAARAKVGVVELTFWIRRQARRLSN